MKVTVTPPKQACWKPYIFKKLNILMSYLIKDLLVNLIYSHSFEIKNSFSNKNYNLQVSFKIYLSLCHPNLELFNFIQNMYLISRFPHELFCNMILLISNTTYGLCLRQITIAPYYIFNHILHHDLSIPFVKDVVKTYYKIFFTCLLNYKNSLIYDILYFSISENSSKKLKLDDEQNNVVMYSRDYTDILDISYDNLEQSENIKMHHYIYQYSTQSYQKQMLEFYLVVTNFLKYRKLQMKFQALSPPTLPSEGSNDTASKNATNKCTASLSLILHLSKAAANLEVNSSLRALLGLDGPVSCCSSISKDFSIYSGSELFTFTAAVLFLFNGPNWSTANKSNLICYIKIVIVTKYGENHIMLSRFYIGEKISPCNDVKFEVNSIILLGNIIQLQLRVQHCKMRQIQFICKTIDHDCAFIYRGPSYQFFFEYELRRIKAATDPGHEYRGPQGAANHRAYSRTEKEEKFRKSKSKTIFKDLLNNQFELEHNSCINIFAGIE
ncbi:hypothetical protein AGLY_001170 [Aphis glycines]|uniref:Uncharacterized protein n=1 Tax=Aphis glycines TaxID=307491 RepID=A0A6G0U9J8_APHGL|nr:hypothetical protein AGLY_001170 [Aphis glycines]